MTEPLHPAALDQLFRSARSQNKWLAKPVSEALIKELYELLKWGPTSANSTPARFVWVASEEGKQRLAAVAAEGNRAKILAAPLTVIIGHDLEFAAKLPKLLPPDRVAAMQKMFALPQVAEVTAMRNGSLQGAYLMLAARSLGLDCGPMSGFNNAAVDEAFFAGTTVRSNFICSVGYGDPSGVYPRLPRLPFDEVSRFA